MNNMSCLLLLVFLMGCAKPKEEDKRQFKNIDGSLEPYYRLFTERFNIQIGDVTAGLTDLSGDMAGICYQNADGRNEIKIDKAYFDAISGPQREELMFHELLHCTINANHNENRLEDGCPQSIMHSSNFGDPCFTQHYTYYIGEFRR